MSTTHQRWFHRRGELTRDGWESIVDGSTPDWAHTGICVAQLTPGESVALSDPGVERIVVPLSGSFIVAHNDGGVRTRTRLNGRATVFSGPTDVLYLSSGSTAVIEGEGRVAVATSPTSIITPSRYIAADEVPVELRGAGASSREVHNFGTPSALDAARLIVCEVITPAENWSSYPPHKHDEHVPGRESRLEEIYYFEAAPVGGSDAGDSAAFGMFSAYSSPAGDIDINAMVRTGDIALVPHGYHGPAVAAPGYDLYYLNVMAGPDPERAWLISDDPVHAWVRDTWNGQGIDSRLPFTPETKGQH
ncbi:5-deoxy-glucuronate isomerase [Microbacterium sp. cx-59]|uniref:5-deoxy-glucuronate isomerase n=1 Tax=Microbacterium sp. cx-59 TaxID=2891207 RepID=UPI001E4EE0AA|nr:5-deoxy-glucuronate isomerase [Microbacterium sp. cx-59]MCC4908756.1 5-deoxy-glucuronate isomerase [Microbacterium sp. cx-59]